jgi:hypothetical protein
VRDGVAALEQVGYTPSFWSLDEALRPGVKGTRRSSASQIVML